MQLVTRRMFHEGSRKVVGVFLIFGIVSNDIPLTSQWTTCQYCGNQAEHQMLKQTRRISLFFIPLVPIGTRWLDTCTACGRTQEISGAQARAAAADTQSQLR